MVGPTLERRLLNLEHVMATLNQKVSPQRAGGAEGSIPQEEDAAGVGGQQAQQPAGVASGCEQGLGM